MKKRYLLLIPVVACIVLSAAAIGYIQFHPDRAPAGAEFLVRTSNDAEQQTKEPEAQPLTASQKRANELLDAMTLEQKLYQMMFVTPEALTQTKQVVRAGTATQEAIEKRPVGGVLYTRQSLQGKAQIKDMLSNTQSYAEASKSGVPVFLGVQEQGGSNAPVAQALRTKSILNAAESTDEQTAYALGQTIAQELSGVGFTVNLAPAVGDDADIASGEIKGLQKNHVLSAASAFPGEDEENLSAFEACIKQKPAFMIVTNAQNKMYDTVPCSVSSKVMTDLLRKKLNYTGIIMTDALQDTALTEQYAEGEAAVLAVQAGADMLLEPSDVDAVYRALFQAVSDGKLTEQRIDDSVQRILTAKIDSGLIA